MTMLRTFPQRWFHFHFFFLEHLSSTVVGLHQQCATEYASNNTALNSQSLRRRALVRQCTGIILYCTGWFIWYTRLEFGKFWRHTATRSDETHINTFDTETYSGNLFFYAFSGTLQLHSNFLCWHKMLSVVISIWKMLIYNRKFQWIDFFNLSIYNRQKSP